MSVLIILIPVSLAMAVAFVAICLASIRAGQFDDLESPRWRVLFDDAAAGLDGTDGIRTTSMGTQALQRMNNDTH